MQIGLEGGGGAKLLFPFIEMSFSCMKGFTTGGF